MFIELHERYTNYPILVRVSAVNTVMIKEGVDNRSSTTVLTIGNERYEVVESYIQVFRMIMGYEEVIDNGGDSAE